RPWSSAAGRTTRPRSTSSSSWQAGTTKESGSDMSERKRLGDVETVPVGRTPIAVDGQGRIDADEWTAERAEAQPPPRPGTIYPPWPGPTDEEPIDAEFTEERPTTGQRARHAWEESRR